MTAVTETLSCSLGRAMARGMHTAYRYSGTCAWQAAAQVFPDLKADELSGSGPASARPSATGEDLPPVQASPHC